MISTEFAHTIGITLGRMWRRMIQMCDAPCERARSTNWRSRSESTCARTMRVVPAQPVIASTSTMMPVLPPGICRASSCSSAAMSTANGTNGITRNQSSRKVSTRSTQPPK